MTARKSRIAKNPRNVAGAKSVRAKRAGTTRHAEPTALARLPEPIRNVLTEARETSREYALASLGAVSKLHKRREARMAEMVAEGKRVEPKIRQAVEQWKENLQSKVEVKKLKLPKLNFDAAEMRERIEELRAASRRRFSPSAR